MSDARVRAAIEQMEAWLADLTWEPDPEALEQWNTEFNAALAQAQRVGEWPDLVARGHAASQMLEARIVRLREAQDLVKSELAAQERGSRALKGYGVNVR